MDYGCAERHQLIDRLPNDQLLDDFFNDFIDKLIEQVQSDNEIKMQNIIHLDTSFAETLDQMKRDFTEKYKWEDNDKERATTNFKEMLRAYISTL